MEIDWVNNLEKIKKINKPVVFISGHFSNFELMAMQIEKLGVNLAAIYRPLNNTFLKFVAFPDDDKYLDDLWQFTSKNIAEKCGSVVEKKDLQDLEIFFKEEGLIASNRELYLPTFENN